MSNLHVEHCEAISVVFFIVCCVIMSAARWFFRPYSAVTEEDMDYMYPARKVAVAFYLQSVFLTAFIIGSGSAPSMLMEEIFLPVFFAYGITIMFRTYYGKVMGWLMDSKIDVALLLPVPVFFAVLFVASVFAPQMLANLDVVKGIALALAMFYTVLYVLIVLKIRHTFRAYADCEKDLFPCLFARRTIMMGCFAIIVSWLGYIVDALRGVAYLVLGLETVLLMIMSLATQRKTQPESVSVAVEKLSKNIKAKNAKCIAEQIRHFMEDERAFLNAKLTVADVADNTDFSRTYVSKVIKDDFGGFYKYVNCLRYKYMEEYLKSNPNITIDVAVEKCGFASRSAYYNARKYVEN